MICLRVQSRRCGAHAFLSDSKGRGRNCNAVGLAPSAGISGHSVNEAAVAAARRHAKDVPYVAAIRVAS